MCRPTNLAARGPFRIDHCSCGCLHLHLGPVMVRLDLAAAPALLALLEQAQERLATPPRWLGPGSDQKPESRN
ncbi:MAG: hypothetical protein JNK49_08700 [Planctomycetes bacterium]|nr:hypothetical protein [Planctomycetota bacterium]